MQRPRKKGHCCDARRFAEKSPTCLEHGGYTALWDHALKTYMYSTGLLFASLGREEN